MPDVPYPITATNADDLKRQIYELVRELFEERIGGLTLGDVFEDSGGVLTLRLGASNPCLQKVSNALQVEVKTAGGLQATSTGIAAKLKSAGGLDVDSGGIFVSSSAYGFGTINCPSGNDPVADQTNDTLNLTATNGLTITGNSTTDTVDVAIDSTSSPTTAGATATNDWTLTCGTNKTLVLNKVVYNDANVGSLVLQTGGTLPGIVQILDNDGDNTGIYTRGFAVGEQGSGVFEIPHDYKEGTDLVFHIHWGANDAPSGTDNVKWQLTYSISRDNNTFPDAITPASTDAAYDTQYEWLRTDIATITGATGGVDGGVIKIGDQFHFTLTRIVADGDAFSGEALVATIGIHYQCDTLGSRQIGAK